jgi:hypothetical protein
MTLRALEERVFTPTGGDDIARVSSASSPSDTGQASASPTPEVVLRPLEHHLEHHLCFTAGPPE